ncbi:hypothetical protein [Thalassotalea fusca]
MKNLELRRILIVWGIVCLLSPLAALLHFPQMKTSTPQSVDVVEQLITENLAVDREASTQLAHAFNGIIANHKAMNKHSDWSYKLLSAVSILSACISFYLVFRLRH